MKKLLCYLKEYKKESVLGPLFKLLEATLELFVPLVVAAIIDTGIGNQDRGYVVKMCLVLVLLGLIGLAFSVTAQYFAAKAAVGFADNDPSCTVWTYPETVLCRTGYPGNIHIDHPYDE